MAAFLLSGKHNFFNVAFSSLVRRLSISTLLENVKTLMGKETPPSCFVETQEYVVVKLALENVVGKG